MRCDARPLVIAVCGSERGCEDAARRLRQEAGSVGVLKSMLSALPPPPGGQRTASVEDGKAGEGEGKGEEGKASVAVCMSGAMRSLDPASIQ
eukprot:1824948-Rhodomonas_salina.1